MAYSDSVYNKADNELLKRRTQSKTQYEERRSSLEKRSPEFVILEKRMAQTAKDVVLSLSFKSKEEIKEHMNRLKQENLQIQADIAALLKSFGLEDDYLEIRHFCDKCGDTGVYKGKRCDCFRALLRQFAYEEMCSSSPLKISSFEDFSLSYYPDSPNKDNVVPRRAMTKIFNFCKTYATDFDTSNPNLFMYGETGLGKTHLSLSIAGEVIKKGFGVIYGSCPNLMSELESEKFQRNNQGSTEKILLECELLILDDVGSEFTTQFTQAAFYNIINTRILLGLPTVISTNLTIPEFEKRYSRRVTSRIIGEYQLLHFTGRDIRQIKKQED